MARKPETWALLIGVNHYIPGNKRRVRYADLSGCVKDVKAIKSYLEKTNVRHITTLTSTKGIEGPEEEESQLPKHQNVTRELERIINDSCPGDLVYVHYSGHGIRRDAAAIDPDEQGAGDSIAGTALALADVMTGGAYLTGYQLGVYIKRMVFEKKLRVTIVLDSCFSGRGLREAELEEYALRCGEAEFDDEVLQSDLDADRAAELTDLDYGNFNNSVSRNATKIRSWLSDPTGCTVLTACDIDETAGEYIFEGEKHGILTYWMLKFLLESPETCRPTYAKVREYVEQNIERARIGKKQSPVLWGDADHTFLGQEKVIERPVGHIIGPNPMGPNTNIVELDIGWAHGVAPGAIYDVYPEKENIRMDSIPKVRAKITEVPHDNPFRSKAVLESATDDLTATAQIKPRSSVVLQSWALPSDVFVDISSISQRLSEKQIQTLESEIKETCGLLFNPDEVGSEIECDFKIMLNQGNNLEVWENGKQMSRVPTVSLGDENWATKLAYLLKHLARFRALLSIDNSAIDTPLNPEWFSFEVGFADEGYDDDFYSDGGPEETDAFQASEGTDLRFTFSINDSCKHDSVYVSFYTFDASWGIYNVHPSFKVTKDTPQEFGLRMMIPPKSNPEDSEDIIDTIRVFISTSKVYWEDITLPGLPNHACSLPPSIVTLPTDPTDSDSGATTRGLEQSLYIDSTEVLTLRNPKRIPLKPKRQPQKGGWGIMDLKISTIPKH